MAFIVCIVRRIWARQLEDMGDVGSLRRQTQGIRDAWNKKYLRVSVSECVEFFGDS